ncbi:hypothetical protein [Massilia sp. TS11]|uniref:hypothetical protein n=1 Tax=Massilia sp. TS11 TaxID=2908003 RepID=UPI001EDB0437|nr:hypothetical protein [Massilia sp. TS11]MCG2583870.1 hypothetical protein [Massilia sp. TS11]
MFIPYDARLAERILRAAHAPLTVLPAALLELDACDVPLQVRQELSASLANAAGYQCPDLLLVEEHAATYSALPPGWRLYLPCLWTLIQEGYNPATTIMREVAELLHKHPVPGMLVSEGDGLYLVRILAAPEREYAAREWLAERLSGQTLRRKLTSLAARARRTAKAHQAETVSPVAYLSGLLAETFKVGVSDLKVCDPTLARRLRELALDLREARLRLPPTASASMCDTNGELAQIAAARELLTQSA